MVKFNSEGKFILIEDKSNTHEPLIGLYFYDNDLCKIAKSVKPSTRGELGISYLNLDSLNRGDLECSSLVEALPGWTQVSSSR